MGKHLSSRSDAARLGFRMSDGHPSPLCAPFTSNSQRRHLGGKMVGPDGGLLGSVPRKETVCPSVRTSAGYGWILDGDRSGRAEQVRPPDMGVVFVFREQVHRNGGIDVGLRGSEHLECQHLVIVCQCPARIARTCRFEPSSSASSRPK